MDIDVVEQVDSFQLNLGIDSRIYFCPVRQIDNHGYLATLYSRIRRHCSRLAMAVTVGVHRFPTHMTEKCKGVYYLGSNKETRFGYLRLHWMMEEMVVELQTYAVIGASLLHSLTCEHRLEIQLVGAVFAFLCLHERKKKRI